MVGSGILMDSQVFEIYDIMLRENVIDTEIERDEGLFYVYITFLDKYGKRQYYFATLG